MNKSDKYYLKQGKLELSMLDDEDDELELSSALHTAPKKDLFADLEFPHTKRTREARSKQVGTSEAKLKVTQDIYNTLHTMGQFLTKSDETEEEENKKVLPKKVKNAAKVQKLEQIASTLKIQEIELPPRADVKEEAQLQEETNEASLFESIPADRHKEEITAIKPSMIQEVETSIYTLQEEMAAEINELLAEEEELETYKEMTAKVLAENIIDIKQASIELKSEEAYVEEADVEETYVEEVDAKQTYVEEADVQETYTQEELASTKEQELKPISVISAIEKEVQEVYYGTSQLEENKLFIESSNQDPNKQLKQKQIDEILETFFGSISLHYTHESELKKHIDKQIAIIRNYK